MSWKEVTIGSFLKERPDRIKPDKANSLNLKRIEKIDFSGNIYFIDNTQTRTNMILVKPGDLVISGINVEKGALAVYEGEEDVLATIHYSSYEFDKSIIDIEYLKWFLTSNVFMNVLKKQVGGGIKTELKPKKFLPLKIKLPDINLQREIAKKINNVSNEIKELKETTEENYKLISKLRQSILQEAVQGKLVPQDPSDEPASVLLEKIKEEKERLIKEKKIKKEKPLPPITEDEIPYELPKGWEWVRLGEIIELISGRDSPIKKCNDEGKGIPYIMGASNISDKGLIIERWIEKPQVIGKKGDLLITVKGTVGKTILLNEYDEVNLSRQVVAIRQIGRQNFKYLHYFIKSYLNEIIIKSKGLIPGISRKDILEILFPIPPLAEQKRIVEKVDQLMALCDELEKNIEQSKKDSELLMQSVLQEAFKEA